MQPPALLSQKSWQQKSYSSFDDEGKMESEVGSLISFVSEAAPAFSLLARTC